MHPAADQLQWPLTRERVWCELGGLAQFAQRVVVRGDVHGDVPLGS
jgi:hypothetical protein